MKIDELCNNIGKRIFELLKLILDKNIINGQTDFIMRVIGFEQLSRLEYFMDQIFEKILQFSNDTKMEDIFSIEEQHFFKSYSDMLYEEIENNYKEYLSVIEAENNYVDELAKMGVVRKI